MKLLKRKWHKPFASVNGTNQKYKSNLNFDKRENSNIFVWLKQICCTVHIANVSMIFIQFSTECNILRSLFAVVCEWQNWIIFGYVVSKRIRLYSLSPYDTANISTYSHVSKIFWNDEYEWEHANEISEIFACESY